MKGWRWRAPPSGVPKNLVLVGYRGAGKSTLGRRIAKRISLKLVSTDSEVSRRLGKSIPDFVAENGWPAFRAEERAVVADFCDKQNLLIDTGGGVVEDPVNVEKLRNSGIVFYLEADARTLENRIAFTGGRPSLTGKASASAEVMEVLIRRDPLYRLAAHHVVDVRDDSFLKAVEVIVDTYHKEIGTKG